MESNFFKLAIYSLQKKRQCKLSPKSLSTVHINFLLSCPSSCNRAYKKKKRGTVTLFALEALEKPMTQNKVQPTL